ncbi:DUF3769 domain-containing protein [uncultured Prochlorococcus sp.]|uniref:DUF3769 domain-containing protein n=1 Tax=uncultured Prochlorococcus sp. TaxID=159733 RepID=UPI0025858649|nr:DUF3769 domain-containing protein [uncultured Prochlorococcus sp.]
MSETIGRKNILINNSNQTYFNKNLDQNIFFSNNFKNQNFKNNLNLAFNEISDQSRNVEIQSDTQFQEENVIYAEGNVIVTYKGNTLKADKLVYDKLNETVKASGNIKLILENQVFISEKLNYDFKNQKGSFFKVKGLIQTKNLIEDLEFTSDQFQEISSTLQRINKEKVLYTPDGINNWIFYTDELKVDKNQWTAKKAIFTNDLLETNQVKFEINSLRIIPKDDELKLKSSISYLIFEDRVPIPFWFGNRTLKKTKDGYFLDLSSKWYLGLDYVDRDGYFVGRKLKPFNISSDFVLNLEPQFLIQRSLQGYTKSFVNKGDSITSDKVRRDVSLSDYFSLNSELQGKVNGWDLTIDKNLYSLDFDKFLDAFRLKMNLSKDIYIFGSKWNKSFYGVYRDKIWNGSIGESEIYVGYGSKLEKLNIWDEDGIEKTERFKIGLGNFKAEALNNKNLVSSYKGSFYYSLNQKIPLVVKESENKFVDRSFNYIFEPVKQGIYLDTKLAALLSLYEDGNHQEYLGFGAGPEFVFGEFKKRFADYTKISFMPFYRLKSGDSIFKFDQVSDKFTLDLALDQQLYGPILLRSKATLNLDGNSKDYGDFINSSISLYWKKRSYEVGIFYQPHDQSGGMKINLYGFE